MAARDVIRCHSAVVLMSLWASAILVAGFQPWLAIAEDQSSPSVKPFEYTDMQKKAMAQVRSKGGQVLALAQTDTRLDVSFHLSDQPVSDEQLELLPALPEVAVLNLRGTKITDAGLVHVGKLSGLTKLHLEKTGIGDAGLAHLSGLEKLEYLNLYGTKVTGAGVKGLAKLPKLQRIYLWQTEVSDADIQELLAARPQLKIIKEVKAPAAPPAKEESPK